MSENEEVSEEEEEEEEEEQEEQEEQEQKEEPEPVKEEERHEETKLRHMQHQEKEEEPEELTEAARAILAAKKRHEEEEEARMEDYYAKRAQEKEEAEEELRILKEKQQKRRDEREQMEKEFADKMREVEDRNRKEELERRERREAERLRKDEERRKREESSGSFIGGSAIGANYTVGRGAKGEKTATISAAAQQEIEKKQKEEAKVAFMKAVNKKVDVANSMVEDLRKIIGTLYQRIVRLEGDKYDLDRRHEGLEYDLKELHEKEIQMMRHKAERMGLDPDEAAKSMHPPKISTSSKFDRRTDQRSYGDCRVLFENPLKDKRYKLVRGTARPPPEWGRKENDELEQLRKTLEPPKFVEQVKAEGDAAKPPVEPIPLSVPNLNEVEEEQVQAPPAPEPIEKPIAPPPAAAKIARAPPARAKV